DRRSLIKLLAAATLLSATSPAAAEKAKVSTVAYLALLPGEDRNFVPKFLHRLDELGYVEGQNLHFVYRSAEGAPELLPGPAAALFAAILNPGTPYSALAYKELEAAAKIAKLEIRAFEIRSPAEIAPQLEAAKAAGAGGLVIFEDPLTLSQRSEIVALASRLRLPAV